MTEQRGPGRLNPATQPPDTLKDGKAREVYVDPRMRPMRGGPAPGMWAPASFPPDRLRDSQSRLPIDPPGPTFPIFRPPGHLCPMTSVDNGLSTAASRTPPTRIWYVSKATTASDLNGGTSLTVRASGVDGIVDSTAGTTKISSPTATWTKDDIGHAICAATVTRVITNVIPARTLGAIVTNGSGNITSVGLFDSSMVGQAITGTNIAANTVIRSVSSANAAGLSLAASGSGTNAATLWPLAHTEGRTVFTASGSQTYRIGGPVATVVNMIGSKYPQAVMSGDTIYIGAGTYRESQISCTTASMDVAPQIIGDTDGAIMGTRGEVRITSYNENDIQSATVLVWQWNTGAGNNWSFSRLTFESSGANSTHNNSNASSKNVSFTDCYFYAASAACVAWQPMSNTASNTTFDRCFFLCHSVPVQITTANTANGDLGRDWDMNIWFRNCTFVSFGSGAISLGISGGANTYKGGGLRLRSCLLIGSSGVNISSTGVSSAVQSTIYDSEIVANGTGLFATTSGQLIEDYNSIQANTPRGSVPVGAHSVGDVNYLGRVGLSVGEERIWGGRPRPMFSPVADNNRYSLGSQDATTVPVRTDTDALGRPRPAGVGRVVTTGTCSTATSGSSPTFNDTSQHLWRMGLTGATLKITGGTAAGTVKLIKIGFSATNVAYPGPYPLIMYSPWEVTPDATSTYSIYWGASAEMLTPTSTTSTTFTNSNAAWITNMFTGFNFVIMSGTGVGQTGTIVSNTATALTFTSATTTTLDTTSLIKLFRGTDENTVGRTVGPYERHDTARAETVLTDAGGIGWRISGYGDQDIRVPVNTATTTITINCSWSTNHGDTTKPQVVLVANPAIGVTAQTVTAAGTAGSGTFETLTFSGFTPTANGVVTVRLCSRSSLPTGYAAFDTVSIS